MKSDLVKSVFQDELERTDRLIRRYEEEVSSLPKGSLFKRKIGNQEYVYLNYRESDKVVSKFLGNAREVQTEELKQKLQERKKLVLLLKKLNADKKALEKELLK